MHQWKRLERKLNKTLYSYKFAFDIEASQITVRRSPADEKFDQIYASMPGSEIVGEGMIWGQSHLDNSLIRVSIDSDPEVLEIALLAREFLFFWEVIWSQSLETEFPIDEFIATEGLVFSACINALGIGAILVSCANEYGFGGRAEDTRKSLLAIITLDRSYQWLANFELETRSRVDPSSNELVSSMIDSVNAILEGMSVIDIVEESRSEDEPIWEFELVDVLKLWKEEISEIDVKTKFVNYQKEGETLRAAGFSIKSFDSSTSEYWNENGLWFNSRSGSNTYERLSLSQECSVLSALVVFAGVELTHLLECRDGMKKISKNSKIIAIEIQKYIDFLVTVTRGQRYVLDTHSYLMAKSALNYYLVQDSDVQKADFHFDDEFF
jgi:hypothetical protein